MDANMIAFYPAGVLPMVFNATGTDVISMIGGFGAGAVGAFGTACPRMVDSVLWVGKNIDFLPGPANPMAAAICPAVKVIMPCRICH
jgi:hypothetical protein